MKGYSQARAKKGGEYGANGEWYEGGKFIARTDRAKSRKPTYRPTRRQQIEIGVWDVPPSENLYSIYERYNQLWMFHRNGSIVMRDLPVDYWGVEFLAKAADALERWKAGERWEVK